jgi:hypothetical protein
MTSQLNVDTIVDKAGSGGTNVKIGNTSTYVSDGGSATQNTVQGLAKAWATVDDNSTIMDSLNIASITDHSTGVLTLTFTNAMNNNLYSITVAGGYGSGTNDMGIISWDDESYLTTTGSRTYFISALNSGSTGSNYDPQRGCYHWLGDLA